MIIHRGLEIRFELIILQSHVLTQICHRLQLSQFHTPLLTGHIPIRVLICIVYLCFISIIKAGNSILPTSPLH